MKHTGKVQALIAFIILAGFFATLYFMIRASVDPGGMRDALLVMVGSLGTMATSIVGYYFGSSSGSARKDEIMAKENA